MNKFTYTIIIPTYTPTENDFRRCLDYIKKQTVQPYEVIVVDDASPSEVPKIALEYGFKYIRHDINKHNGGARNTGMKEATGDYLIFCNSDDYFELDTIEEIEKVNKGQELILLGFRSFGNWKTGTKFIPSKENTPNISQYNWNGESLHVVKRQFILDNNLFELENVPIADRDWTLRLEALKPTYTFVPKILYNYQVGHDGAIMTDIIKGNIVSNLTNPDYYKKEQKKEDKNKNIDIIIYEHLIPRVGGNTTSLINWCKHMSKYYNIKVLFKSLDNYRLVQLSSYAVCELYKNQELECDKLIWNSSWGDYPDTIKYKGKPIQMLHANYKEVKKLNGFVYKTPKVETDHIAVSKHVSEVFEEMYGIKSKVVYNMLDPEVKVEKVLRLISATRLIESKGLSRIIKFANELSKRNKRFLWFIYGDGNDGISINRIKAIPNIILMPVSFDLPSYLADADYLAHFSDTEGDPYCTKEALQVNTPCLTTNYPATFEQLEDGKNGYILDFDLFDKGTEKEWDDVINKIYTKIPKFQYENKDDEIEKTWLEILGKPVGEHINIEKGSNIMYRVKAIRTFPYSRFGNVKNLKRIGADVPNTICQGDIFEISTLEEYNYLLGNNPLNMIAIELLEIIKEEKPKSKKK